MREWAEGSRPKTRVGPGCRSDLRVGTGRRDRRSKYWDIGTLSPCCSFDASDEEAKKKERIKMEKGENCSSPCDIHTENSSSLSSFYPPPPLSLICETVPCRLYANLPILFRMLPRTNLNNTEVILFHRHAIRSTLKISIEPLVPFLDASSVFINFTPGGLLES